MPARLPPTRRTVLLGALASTAAAVAGGELIARDTLPGRVRLWQLLGLNGPDGAVPDTTPGPVLRDRFTSTARGGRTVTWTLALPPGATTPGTTTPGTTTPGARLPVCVVLHGHGDDDGGLLRLGLDRFLADAVGRGTSPFALAAVAGGNGYWHRRRDGDDPGRMVVEEFLPALARLGLAADPGERIALLGWSMGGFGALLLAQRLGAARVAAVGAMSPALWQRADDAVAGAFDDDADRTAHDVFAGRDRLRGITVRVDCGRGDPFLGAARAFAAGLHPAPQGGFAAGGHTDGYWRRVIPGQLTTIGDALTPARHP